MFSPHMAISVLCSAKRFVTKHRLYRPRWTGVLPCFLATGFFKLETSRPKNPTTWRASVGFDSHKQALIPRLNVPVHGSPCQQGWVVRAKTGVSVVYGILRKY